jgi:hypothetical protein
MVCWQVTSPGTVPSAGHFQNQSHLHPSFVGKLVHLLYQYTCGTSAGSALDQFVLGDAAGTGMPALA